MLTSDIALKEDEKYRPFADLYAGDMKALEADFAEAWYQLTSRDMGPASRCIGDTVPAPRPFQFTLAESKEGEALPDYVPVRAAIQEYLDANPNAVAGFSDLARGCAGTFRATDYRGGCNGGRVLFAPESD